MNARKQKATARLTAARALMLLLNDPRVLAEVVNDDTARKVLGRSPTTVELALIIGELKVMADKLESAAVKAATKTPSRPRCAEPTCDYYATENVDSRGAGYYSYCWKHLCDAADCDACVNPNERYCGAHNPRSAENTRLANDFTLYGRHDSDCRCEGCE